MKTAQDEVREKRAKDLVYWTERALWTDFQFLAEFGAQKRQEAKSQIEMNKAAQKSDEEITAYVHKYGTDEG